jgi:hypothetical protein
MRVLVALLIAAAIGDAAPSPLRSGEWGYAHADADGVTLMAGALKLGGQAGWAYYNGGDAPEGAYFGRLPGGATSLVATVKLPQPLAAGRYYLFVKGVDYDERKSLRASLGGDASAPVLVDDRDGNGLWSGPAVIDAASPADVLRITLLRNLREGRFVFKGLYLTRNDKITVTREDEALTLVRPTVMDDSAPIKGNLVSDGGFEAGIDASWGFEGNREGLPSRDLAEAAEGRASLRVSIDGAANVSGRHLSLVSRIYALKPNKKYTLSMWLKTSAGRTATAAIGLRNAYQPPAGFPPRAAFGASAQVSDRWQRWSATGYALAYPGSDYHITIMANEVPGASLWIDGVQLEEGDLGDYAPAAAVSTQVVIESQPGNVFYEDEPIAGALVAANASPSPATVDVRTEIYDHLNRLVRQGSRSVEVPARSTRQIPVPLSVGKRGIFRLVSWVEGQATSERELIYSVIPRPRVAGADPSSYLGIHPNYTDAQLTLIQKLGIKWARALSPSGFFRWSVVEPVEGQFVWHDAELRRAAEHGITTMGTIGTNNFWPAWADRGGLPDLAKWETFVGKLASHYRPWVRHWEIWNEPHFSPDFYAQMLKRAADAIEASNPEARIVAMGGVPLRYMQSVIAALEKQYPEWDWKRHFAVLSTHDYPNGVPPEGFKAPIIDARRIPVWNTETGAWDLGFYQGEASNFSAPGRALWPCRSASRYYNGMVGAPNLLVQNFLRTIASGQTKYFYYDSRVAASPAYPRAHPTILEYDGTVRVKGILYAIAGSLIDHATGLGNAVSGRNSYLLVFDTAAGPLAALFSSDYKPRQITLDLNPSQFQVLDVMGNPVPSGATVAYGRLPVYLRGIGLTAESLKAALQRGTIAPRADTAAPNLSISAGPRGPVAGGAFRLRWIAIDEVSYPNLGEINPESNAPSDVPNPEALLYSYRLAGTTDAWSPWRGETTADFSLIPPGTYTFEVKAKDEAGNVSPVAPRTIVVR